MGSAQMAERIPEPRRPLVSVIMPCYNAASFVKEAVGSALGQTYRELELLVVDDGSDDGSVEVLQQLLADNPIRMRLLRQHRRGPYPARNLGLRHATGKLIAFLDADDRWRPDFLERMHAALAAHDADLAYCGWQNFGAGAPGVEPYVPPAYEEGDPVDAFLRTCPWPIHAALVRRPIIEAVGGFSEERFSSMDYDLWLRILGQTRRIVRVPEVMSFYRWHASGQVSSVKWRQVLDALAAQKSFIREHPALVGHLSAARIADMTEGQVLRQAYRAVWRRDIASAHRLFRHVGQARAFHARDLRHVAAALLPMPLYARLVSLRDRTST
jgi:glycosyltransferase involved in cell wall biosynthesis